VGQVAKNVDRHVGERIRARRAEMGLTQTDLAKALNLSYQQMQKYETAANRISAGKLFEVAQRLQVPPSFFLTGWTPR
jgi:transcriptional regulator with XRE-family HTH domain